MRNLRTLKVLMPVLWLGAAHAYANKENTLVDYELVAHIIFTDEIRAGIHDEGDVNDYYFTVTLYGVNNTDEEKSKPIADRKNVKMDGGEFGDTSISALSYWRPTSEERESKQYRVEGTNIRELVSQTMKEFEISEAQVAVMVEVEMFERNKKFIFFGQDKYVAKARYFPIPWSAYDLPSRTNQQLTIEDTKGTNVRIKIKYDKPVEKQFIVAKER